MVSDERLVQVKQNGLMLRAYIQWFYCMINPSIYNIYHSLYCNLVKPHPDISQKYISLLIHYTPVTSITVQRSYLKIFCHTELCNLDTVNFIFDRAANLQRWCLNLRLRRAERTSSTATVCIVYVLLLLLRRKVELQQVEDS